MPYFINSITDDKIYVSNQDLKHSMSFRNDDQVYAVNAIDELIKNALPLKNENAKNDEIKTTKKVKIYYCPINIHKKQYSARLTVKEYYKGSYQLDELHLYNYQLRETAANAQRPSTNNSIPAHPLTAAVFSIADLLHDTQFEDREYLNNITQKLDSNGEPLAVF